MEPSQAASPSPISAEQRKATLAATVRAEVLKGGVVQSQTEFDAVVMYPRKSPGCVKFVLLSCFTAGCYLLYWTYAQATHVKRKVIAVDEWGRVTIQKALTR